MRTCTFTGCTKAHQAKGLCHAHYTQQRRGSDLTPLGTTMGRPKNPNTPLKPERRIRHGIVSSYNNQKCRCDLCKAAWNGYCAGRKKRRHSEFKTLPKGYTHGTEAAYQRGCKCEECKRAHSGILRAHKYELSPEQRKRLASPSTSCDMCGAVTPKVQVDHRHGTKFVRGLLCTRHNTGIGQLGDTIKGLKQALIYLESAEDRWQEMERENGSN